MASPINFSASRKMTTTETFFCSVMAPPEHLTCCSGLIRFHHTKKEQADYGSDQTQNTKNGRRGDGHGRSPGVFAQQTGQGGKGMSFYERGPVRIHYEESGSG